MATGTPGVAPSQDDLDTQIQERRRRLQGLVGAGPSESSTQGINHLAIFALDLEATAEFYVNVLEMPLTRVVPNRDEPHSTHMSVDIGNGVSLSFFDFPHVERLKIPAPEGVGGMMHVEIPVAEQRYIRIEERLRDRGIPYQRIGRGVYFKDPNGMMPELMIVERPGRSSGWQPTR